MIITRTPLRISLAGGGTDMPGFYEKNDFGAVVSFAIDKCIYVSVNRKFDGRTRVAYSRAEEVDEIRDLKHDIARETLLAHGIKGVEITSTSDIPGEGTGMGSSSAYAVGLDLALRAHGGVSTNDHPGVYAELAYHIERERCGHPVGKQDHYAAAYGGVHYYQFEKDRAVAQSLNLKESQIHWLEETLLLFYTGKTRSANVILKDQEENISQETGGAWIAAKELRVMAVWLRNELVTGNMDAVGEILRDSWEFKKRMSGGISETWIDTLILKGIGAGATGGKICGAGGGGFLLFAVPQGKQLDVERVMSLQGCQRVFFKIEARGSQVIYNGGKDG